MITLPFTEGSEAWQVSMNRVVILGKAFTSANHIHWQAQFGDERFMVSDSDLRPVPQLEKPLEEGDRIAINKVPATVIRDAFPGLPGGKGVVARKIVEERNKGGAFTTIDDLVARMGLSQVNWQEVGAKLDFSL